ncbi:MAG: hypothetical protein JEZ01_11590 [Labilibaculum sp.]|nr:hypothetical protein [Labilibaculum sp.]MBI9058395.1 hypothetical protein [Labilibaculum sp.]
MHKLNILGGNKDNRAKTHVIYALIKISDYLDFIGDKFDEFGIQRKRENHKGYARLKKDIREGAVLPPITLAVKPENVRVYSQFINPAKFNELAESLEKDNDIYILDGLQRTHIIKDLKEEGFVFNDEQQLMLEFWFEEDMGNLIYRLIVLNSGQKPMSMRHQVELLFMTMQDKLKEDIPGLEMFNEREKKNRTTANMFPFDRIVSGYHSLLNESPEINKGKLISEKLDSGRVITDSELVILQRYDEYTNYLKKYLKLDKEVFRIYNKYKPLTSAKNWLADENIVNSFFASIGVLSEEPIFKERIDRSIDKLIIDLSEAAEGSDPLYLRKYDEIRQNFNPKQFNIGFITRKTVMSCFSEFFRNEGLLSFEKCWNLVNPNK